MRRITVDDIYSIEIPEEPAISPDGSRVAYVLRTASSVDDSVERSLWIVGSDGGVPARLTSGPKDSAPAWSPDGRWLAFLRESDGVPQVWLLSSSIGEAMPLTDLPLGAGVPVWSPDGRHIAFSAPARRESSEFLQAPTAGHGAAPVEILTLDYQPDGEGLRADVREHIHLVTVGTGDAMRLTSDSGSYGRPTWAPDGSSLAFAGAVDADADLTGRSAAYVLDIDAAGRSPRRIGPTEGHIDAVAGFASGGLIAVGRPDTTAGHSRLLSISLETGAADDLAVSFDRNVMCGAPAYPGAGPHTGPDGALLFCARVAGCTHLFALRAGETAPTVLIGGAGRVVSGLSVSATGRIAVVLATPESFGEIVTMTLDGGAETACTAHHEAALPGVDLFESRQRAFVISDGTSVEGWLLRDPDAPTPQPLVLDVHGGPHNAWNAAADPTHLYHQELVARGWAILLLNPRGSDGYGEAFYQATVGSWGRADSRDFLEPVDELVREGLADPNRVAIAGYSYGGFIVCYLTGHRRFAAAVAGAPVTDLVSLAGTADNGHHVAVTELGSPWWSAPELFRELSPITYAADARTPTLLLQGDADTRCPVGQSQQWFAVLRGKQVPTSLVLYPGSSHLFPIDGRPSHRVDYQRRLIDWIERFTKSTGAPGSMPWSSDTWGRQLQGVAEEYGLPGAVLGILRVREGHEDELIAVSHGVLNTRTQVAATPDSLFQIGSITKVWTASLLMQLVEEGQLELDTPIQSVLPELRLHDKEAMRLVTVRHLLTHTSGIDGDLLTDTGRGDDCVERYVSLLGSASQVFSPGESFSYCNAGFVIGGRIVERITGLVWDEAMRTRLFRPLGLANTVTLPEEALLFRCAVGHVSENGSNPVPAPFWTLPRSMGPAGLIVTTAADLLAFARMHLCGGLASNKTRLLSGASVAAMQDKHADLPDRGFGRDSWGLGWGRFAADGGTIVGHDGGTVGQSAFLRAVPERGLAVALLTNCNNGGGGRAGEAANVLLDEVLSSLAGVRLEQPPQPPEPPVSTDLARHVGVYERESMRVEVIQGGDGLTLRMTGTDSIASQLPNQVEEYELIALDEHRYMVSHGPGSFAPVTFYSLDSGKELVHIGGRSTPRVS